MQLWSAFVLFHIACSHSIAPSARRNQQQTDLASLSVLAPLEPERCCCWRRQHTAASEAFGRVYALALVRLREHRSDPTRSRRTGTARSQPAWQAEQAGSHSSAFWQPLLAKASTIITRNATEGADLLLCASASAPSRSSAPAHLYRTIPNESTICSIRPIPHFSAPESAPVPSAATKTSAKAAFLCRSRAQDLCRKLPLLFSAPLPAGNDLFWFSINSVNNNNNRDYFASPNLGLIGTFIYSDKISSNRLNRSLSQLIYYLVTDLMLKLLKGLQVADPSA